jgi:hypothetical protein
VTSTVLVPAPGERWLRFDTLDDRPEGTRIVYTILDEKGELLLYPALPGSDISALGDTPIQLRAELATDDPAATPMVFEWSLETEQPPSVAPGALPLATATLLDSGHLWLTFLALGLLTTLAVRRRRDWR